MQIAENAVALFHYTLTNDAGEVLDSSRGREPLAYLHGAGNIVPGLEEAMAGKKVGDAFKVDVAPEDGYGLHHEGLVQEVPRAAFQGVDEIEEGMSFQAQTPQGVHSVTVTKVTPEMVTVDGNHPLAGQTLHFDVEVTEVRAATDEELAHGHVHGAGGTPPLMYTLYGSPGAASFVVHWLLIETGAAHEYRKVDTAAGEHKRPEYLAINPNGLVPTLVIGGHPVYEAAALILQLADAHPEANLAPALGSIRRAQYYQWVLHFANTLQPAFRIWFYPSEPAGEANAEIAKHAARERIEAAWQRIDTHLGQHGPYLLGDDPTAADFLLTMLMRWSRNMPRPASDWPHLAALIVRMKARESFRTLYEREGLTEWA